MNVSKLARLKKINKKYEKETDLVKEFAAVVVDETVKVQDCGIIER